jgi:hypothetical protein
MGQKGLLATREATPQALPRLFGRFRKVGSRKKPEVALI